MAKVTKKAAPVVDEKKKGGGDSRYLGRTSGKRVAEYQNESLAANLRNKLTDEELAKDWRTEFPKAKAFDAGTVRVVRNLYNRGKHKNDAPAKPTPEFDDSGIALPFRGEKSAKKKEAAAPAPPVKTTKVKVKKAS